tara:strand:- start:1273 stop:2667 length:1395 start_codon:yes stop_codon:yes gene_type:complete
MLQYPPADWINRRSTIDGMTVLDVAVVGGGMCGLVATFALLKSGVSNIRTFDANKEGFEGPWSKYARMETLRSPKTLAGPALGIPNLTFQAWFEAQWGIEGWESFERIPTRLWMDYLIWYRKVLNLKIENEKQVIGIEPASYGFNMRVTSGESLEDIPVRKIILATGREGMAEPRVPGILKEFLGPNCQHSSEDICFKRMVGKDVAVVGISASAVDNAASALEAGASKVYVMARASAVPRVNKMKSTVYSGFTHGFPRLPVLDRLNLLSYVFEYRVAPPRNSVQRVWAHQKAKLCLNAEVLDASLNGNRIRLSTHDEIVEVDNIILGTGFKINIHAPKLLVPFADKIRIFRDSSWLAEHSNLGEFLDFPDLGEDFELQEKVAGSAPYLKNIHEFTFAATVSHGNVSGDIPAISEGAERLVKGICASIFTEDYQDHLANLYSYEEPELLGDEIPSNRHWWPEMNN